MRISESISKLETDIIPKMKSLISEVGDIEINITTPKSSYDIKDLDIIHGIHKDKVFLTLKISEV